MARHFPHWLKAFVNYASFGEAPLSMYFWVGVSALAGALRRQVWIDQGYFKWFANFYIVVVAPPGVVAKSTTASIGMDLLKDVPGVKFGPDVVTWQALVQSLAEATESFELNGSFHPMSAITIESSEFGNFLNPHDREMVDLLVSLYDGRKSFHKVTKTSGSDTIECPWVNIIACTTPAWISGNFPEYMIGGGFTSRCIFVYAETKRQYVAYPSKVLPPDFHETRTKLIEDLIQISYLRGEYKLTPEAEEWGKVWYRQHYENRPVQLDNERFGGYIARKQTHIHKLAMVIAAAQRSELIITREDLESANHLVTSLEAAMPKVFSKIGLSDQSKATEELLSFIRSQGSVEYTALFRNSLKNFDEARDLEAAVDGLVKSGYIRMETGKDGLWYIRSIAVGDKADAAASSA
jgi:hypothetical protein